MWRNWSEMKLTSRLWAFALNKPVEAKTELDILAEIQKFCNTWTSHNSPIIGSAAMNNNRFLFIAAESSNISGCSQDQLRKVVEEILLSFGIELMDPSIVVWTDLAGNWQKTNWLKLNGTDLKEIRQMVNQVFSPFPLSIEELNSCWPYPAEHSLLLR